VPLVEDSDFFLESLDSDLFPGVSPDVKVHNGFRDAQSDSAYAVLDAVQSTIASTGTSNVAVVGHSLGAAIALIDTLFLSMNLDPGINLRHIGYGLPRVRGYLFLLVFVCVLRGGHQTGNQAFADLVDSTLHSVHINNQKDFVPILPGRFLGFHSPSGEIHIEADGSWVSCPGQDSSGSSPPQSYRRAEVTDDRKQTRNARWASYRMS
jgi:predicted lipase